jgi:hypothetical protein
MPIITFPETILLYVQHTNTVFLFDYRVAFSRLGTFNKKALILASFFFEI